MHSDEIKSKIKSHFLNACKNLDRNRYAQESAYVDAFIGRLDGELDIGSGQGTIKFTPTIIADRGAGSAESKYGADFAIVFQSNGIGNPIEKAIIAQAKNGPVDALSSQEENRLSAQCQKMARITRNYIVLEAPRTSGAMPTIKIGNPDTGLWHKSSIDFDEYFLEQVLSCIHGDRDKSFINGVSTSQLSGIKVDVNGLEYTPETKPRKKHSRRPNGSSGMEP